MKTISISVVMIACVIIAVMVRIPFVSTLSFAAEFQPTVMKLSCPPEIEYKFNDKPLIIPFTISGTPAAVWLVINTHGQAEDIVDVRNGHLGWHYVNKIDTTVYVSQRYERDIGETEIIWDGNDQDGEPVEAGTYDYYLWAYDDQSNRQLASYFVTVGYAFFNPSCKIYELGEDGMPLARPLLMGNQELALSDNSVGYKRFGTHYKWEIGSNPTDGSLLQTTLCAMYYQQPQQDVRRRLIYGGPAFNPDNHNIFYHTSKKTIVEDENDWKKYATILKWKFITDGEAELDRDWLGWDEAIWEEWWISGSYDCSTCYTDRNYIYIANPGSGSWEIGMLKCISFEGDVIYDRMMFNRYMPYEYNKYCTIERMYSRSENHWFLISPWCCMLQMIDISRLLDDPEDDTDLVVFENRNGDYFMDNGWEPDSEFPWYCSHYSQLNQVIPESISIDSNGFSIIHNIWLGLTSFTSFGVATQDGTGIGYMSFADDTDTEKFYKSGGVLCDSGSNYDGLYMNGAATPETNYREDIAKAYYVAFDSAHGIITNKPITVEEEKHAVFSVEQNTPNPFNPSTIISFTIPEQNYVTIYIYNIAGQKVYTSVDDFMEAGKHSVTWDASGFSAGVYFYTVKSGIYEKTMKMTVLK